MEPAPTLRFSLFIPPMLLVHNPHPHPGTPVVLSYSPYLLIMVLRSYAHAIVSNIPQDEALIRLKGFQLYFEWPFRMLILDQLLFCGNIFGLFHLKVLMSIRRISFWVPGSAPNLIRPAYKAHEVYFIRQDHRDIRPILLTEGYLLKRHLYSFLHLAVELEALNNSLIFI